MKTEAEIREALNLIASEAVRQVLAGADKRSMGYEAGMGTVLGWMIGSPIESRCFERILAALRGERPDSAPLPAKDVSPTKGK